MIKRNELLIVIADAITEIYGDTICEYNFDIKLAKGIFDRIKDYVPHAEDDNSSVKLLSLYKKEREKYWMAGDMDSKLEYSDELKALLKIR